MLAAVRAMLSRHISNVCVINDCGNEQPYQPVHCITLYCHVATVVSAAGPLKLSLADDMLLVQAGATQVPERPAPHP